jgi:hypothetical protein
MLAACRRQGVWPARRSKAVREPTLPRSNLPPAAGDGLDQS